jgi:predicted dithiol-disulfide oxidoreductase (DUF899 family)
MKTPPIVSRQEWEAARQQLLVKEKELSRARDALAAKRRRMPWLAVEKTYEFQGPAVAGERSRCALQNARRFDSTGYLRTTVSRWRANSTISKIPSKG